MKSAILSDAIRLPVDGLAGDLEIPQALALQTLVDVVNAFQDEIMVAAAAKFPELRATVADALLIAEVLSFRAHDRAAVASDRYGFNLPTRAEAFRKWSVSGRDFAEFQGILAQLGRLEASKLPERAA